MKEASLKGYILYGLSFLTVGQSQNYGDNQRRQWHPTPVLLPGESHRWRSLVGYSPWGRKELDVTSLSFTFFTTESYFNLKKLKTKWD